MATKADAIRIARALPGSEINEEQFAFAVMNKGKLKGYAWVWKERVHPKKSRVPQPRVLAVRVASLADKDFLVGMKSPKFFTEPHYNGFPAILVRLAEVTVRELRPLLTEAWRTQAPKELLAKPARK